MGKRARRSSSASGGFAGAGSGHGLRNRELANLIVVGILTALGFASVYIARQAVVSTASLSYAGSSSALYLAAHLVCRLTVPNADPYLLPMAGAADGDGLTEIYRLDRRRLPPGPLDRGRGDRARRDAAPSPRGLPAARATSTSSASARSCCRCCRAARGRPVRERRALWVHVGSLQFQPGELAKIVLIVFLAGYLREKREVLAQGRLKDFGPLLLIWGGAMLVLVETNDLGSALLYFGIFLSMLYVATARIGYVLAGVSALRRRRGRRLPDDRARADARPDLADPWTHVHDDRLPVPVALLDLQRRLHGGPGSARARSRRRTARS